MNNVVPFKPGSPKRKPPPDAPCEVLFFTGVRYVRFEAPKRAPRKTRLRRPRSA